MFGSCSRYQTSLITLATLALISSIYLGLKEETRTHTISLKKLLTASVEIAKFGGHQVRSVRQNIDIGERIKDESLKDPVTEGDMRSHKVMFYGLKKTFPGLSVISEEDDPSPVDMNLITAATLSDPDVDEVLRPQDDVLVPFEDVDVWIDPLDATKEYTENLLQYVTTMVCVAIKGQPIIGVIHKPFENVTLWGWAGPNIVNKKLDSGDGEDGKKTRLIVSRSHAGSVHQVAEKAFGSEVEVTPAGGAGFKSWEVAEGRQDAYVHVTLIKKWDICPGNALLRAAGGRMTTLAGADIDYSGKPALVKNMGGVLATMSNHDDFVEKLKDTLVTVK